MAKKKVGKFLKVQFSAPNQLSNYVVPDVDGFWLAGSSRDREIWIALEGDLRRKLPAEWHWEARLAGWQWHERSDRSQGNLHGFILSQLGQHMKVVLHMKRPKYN